MHEHVLRELLSAFTDPELDEILINGARACFQIKAGVQHERPSLFENDTACLDWLFEFSASEQVRLDALHPTNGGLCAKGMFRWHAMLPPLSYREPLFSLRRIRYNDLRLGDFSDPHGYLPQVLEHLKAQRPLVICGLTGSGKSSFLSSLLWEFCLEERVLLLESIPELSLQPANWIQMCERQPDVEGQGAVNMQRLLNEGLRLRPDRIVIGEIRSSEFPIFTQTLSLNDRASITTMHAGSMSQALTRLGDFAGIRIDELRSHQLGICMLERANPPKLIEFGGCAK